MLVLAIPPPIPDHEVIPILYKMFRLSFCHMSAFRYASWNLVPFEPSSLIAIRRFLLDAHVSQPFTAPLKVGQIRHVIDPNLPSPWPHFLSSTLLSVLRCRLRRPLRNLKQKRPGYLKLAYQDSYISRNA